MIRPRSATFLIGAWAAIQLAMPTPGDGAEAVVTSSGGATVVWSEWVNEHGPIAVVLWSSWAPGAETTRGQIDELAAAARQHRLGLVLVSVQEPFEEADRALKGLEVLWFHDRFGRLLKDYRVVAIPALVVVAADGRIAARLDATAASLRDWKAE
jgi:hypothetical protein